MEKFSAIMALGFLLLSFSASAADFSGNIYTAGVSKYLWRGSS